MHYQDDHISIDKFEVGGFENNCYVISDPTTGDALIVDAPSEADTIAEHARGLNVAELVLTHGHGDHVQALEQLRSRLGVSVGCHEADQNMLPAGPDFLVKDDDELRIGGLVIRALDTPGHTPGGICLLCDQNPEGRIHLFSGDTLFPGGPGATRPPLGDFATIIESIETRLFTLPDDTIVYPGHGLDTTIGRERPHLPEWIERGY